ncbi:carbohydrate-binding protein [Flavobacterium sp. H4147]|uniref:carbohydrate-binding protein n=1 Tax=Flavobacterium sp. H4147 TaxID=3034149 RepID=UPI0023EBB014|nr:carbohydrate-binding protein [Flavobacterium sp. H4147]
MKAWSLLICGIAVGLLSFVKPVDIGKPWKGTFQQIPGKIECEFYDEGGEGIAYHDTDTDNNGSGKLNPVNGNPLHEFRIKEGVDISYTKDGDIDNTSFNKVSRSLNQLYLGWTQPSEWINYSVEVQKSGTYTIGVLYTANGDGAISIDVNGKDATGLLTIESTHDDKDPVDWRQWHHWNESKSLGKIKLKKGKQLLTLHIVKNGNMNLDYLNFIPN